VSHRAQWVTNQRPMPQVLNILVAALVGVQGTGAYQSRDLQSQQAHHVQNLENFQSVQFPRKEADCLSFACGVTSRSGHVAEQGIEHLTKPGAEGGNDARHTWTSAYRSLSACWRLAQNAWESTAADVFHKEEQLLENCPQIVTRLEAKSLVQQDLLRVRRTLQKARHKAVPPWSILAAMWIAPLSKAAFLQKSADFFASSSVWKTVPLRWSGLWAANEDKCNAKAGCTAFCILHLLDDDSKPWARSLWEPSSHLFKEGSHSYLPWKQRDFAVLKFCVARWRMLLERHGVLAEFADMTNALPGIDLNHFDFILAARDLVSRRSWFLLGRHRRAILALTFDPVIDQFNQQTQGMLDKLHSAFDQSCNYQCYDDFMVRSADDAAKLGGTTHLAGLELAA
jgi:hypothetical protein